MVVSSWSLPPYPSSQALLGLQPSQRSSTLANIASALSIALSFPDNKLANASVDEFISSYVRNSALDVLSSLVYGGGNDDPPSHAAKAIRSRTFQLAERRAGNLDLQTLFDLAVVYAPSNAARTKALFKLAFGTNPQLLSDLSIHAVPSFARLLLSLESGLHALRKTVFCIATFVRCVSPEVVELFASDAGFIVAVAQCYHVRLSTIAASYGGINIDQPDEDGEATMLIKCKVDLLDVFHALVQQLIANVAANPAGHADHTLDVFLALLELPSPSSSSRADTPFLNRSLLQDYQQTYALSSTLSSAFANARYRHARLATLDRALRAFDADARDAGALTLVLRSSGFVRDARTSTKGKERAPAPIIENDTMDLAISSVMEILPDQQPEYVRALLTLPAYDGDAEKVVNALLTGEAPPPELVTVHTEREAEAESYGFDYSERRNVFDDERIDPTTVSIGKRHEDAILRNTAFTRQMKEDILRRVAEQSDSEDEDELEADLAERAARGRRGATVAFEDELDGEFSVEEAVKLAVAGDGEGSEGEGGGGEREEQERRVGETQSPETTLELAYIRDPTLFNRDAATRRAKARADLKAQTGWSDEQIEGWRIMLERNPRKDKILQKHEFAGNRPELQDAPQQGASATSSNQQQGMRGGPRGRGRGRGGGGGGGRGGGDSGGGGDRAWKGKNKARGANHDRKRGHDKKMARGGGGPPIV